MTDKMKLALEKVAQLEAELKVQEENFCHAEYERDHIQEALNSALGTVALLKKTGW